MQNSDLKFEKILKVTKEKLKMELKFSHKNLIQKPELVLPLKYRILNNGNIQLKLNATKGDVEERQLGQE